jgi:hypothetical protein
MKTMVEKKLKFEDDLIGYDDEIYDDGMSNTGALYRYATSEYLTMLACYNDGSRKPRQIS